MNAADGSKSANNAITVGLKNAQTSLTSTQGAVGTIAVPAGTKTLSQQTSQALTQETGYLQVVSATVNDPTSASAAQVQPSAANLVTTLIPLETIAPGAQKSVYGVDNFYNWSQGAAEIAKARDRKPNVIVQQNTTTVAPQTQTAPDGGGIATGDRTVNDTVGRPTITAGSNVSDGFARAILTAAATYYQSNGFLPDGVTLSVTSPTTGSTYNVSYTTSMSGDTVYATNLDGTSSSGNDVSFPASDADGTG